jgi:hypothetical protein
MHEAGVTAGPPPLRPFGLVLRRDGTFWHEGVQVTHPKLHAQFLRSVEWAEEEGTFIVRLRHFRGWLDVEDTPWFVSAYDADRGELELTDGHVERLRVESLRADPDGVLRCGVRDRWEARFTREGQTQLLEAIELKGDAPRLHVGREWVKLPVGLIESQP